MTKTTKNDFVRPNKDIEGCHPDGYLPYVTEVTKEMLVWAESHIKETPETRTRSLKEIREVLREECPNLRFLDEDGFLLKFLRARNFKVKRAADMIKRYYMFLELHRDFFEKYLHYENNFDYVEKIVNAGIGAAHPYRDSKNRAILCVRAIAWNPDDLPPDIAICSGMVACKSAIEMSSNQIMGYIVIFDLKGFSFKHAFALFPKYTVFAVQGLQHCVPGKVHEIHVLNFPELFRVVWNVLKNLMSEKIRKRIIFHRGGQESLHKHIPKKLLFEEFGGDLGPMDNSHWCNRPLLERLQGEYAKELTYGFTEFEKKKDKNSEKHSVLSSIGLALLEGLRRASGDS